MRCHSLILLLAATLAAPTFKTDFNKHRSFGTEVNERERNVKQAFTICPPWFCPPPHCGTENNPCPK